MFKEELQSPDISALALTKTDPIVYHDDLDDIL